MPAYCIHPDGSFSVFCYRPACAQPIAYASYCYVHYVEELAGMIARTTSDEDAARLLHLLSEML